MIFEASLHRSLIHHKRGNAGNIQADNSDPISHCLTNDKTKKIVRVTLCLVQWTILVIYVVFLPTGLKLNLNMRKQRDK